MKKSKKRRLLKNIIVQNPVAKFAHQFNKPLIFKDKTKYSRKAKHKTEEVSPIVPTKVGIIGEASFFSSDIFKKKASDFLITLNLRKIIMKKQILTTCLLLAGSAFATSAMAGATCADLPTAAELKTTLLAVLAKNDYGGDGHPAWMTLVDASGTVCAVVTSIQNPGPDADVTTTMSGLGHRLLSAHKANTSNTYSHDHIALASGNLYWLTLPGGAMYGTTLPAMDSVSTGDPMTWGTTKDPMIGKRVGGFSALAGGLALFNAQKHKVGAIGVSGNPFCTAHTVAWKVREKLRKGAYTVKNLPGGVNFAEGNDALIEDVVPDASGVGGPGKSPSGFGYPVCNFNPPDATDSGSIVGNP
jgi:hypothetical protein